MDMMEVIKARHSVRQYEDRKVPAEIREQLQAEVDAINKESGLHIQILFDEPRCFNSMMAHYGKFSGVQNYIALVGPKGSKLEEQVGYYGERLVLLAQSLGLNTCWVAMTHGKSAAQIGAGERQACLISLGYGSTQGVPHVSKPMEQLVKADGELPDWFREGMEAVMLAPTAMNQQKFLFTLQGDKVTATAGRGFYTGMDLGIARYHYEAVTGRTVG